jgi:hypothetical protein
VFSASVARITNENYILFSYAAVHPAGRRRGQLASRHWSPPFGTFSTADGGPDTAFVCAVAGAVQTNGTRFVSRRKGTT